jgi:hypothetical protein
MPIVAKGVDEAKWLRLRQTATGGTDVDDLGNVEPYGCIFKMMHDKRGDPYDVPRGRMRAAERGSFLEDKVVEIYLMEHPGAKVVRFRPKSKFIEILEPGSETVKLVKRPKRMRANKDRMIADTQGQIDELTARRKASTDVQEREQLRQERTALYADLDGFERSKAASQSVLDKYKPY